MKKEWKDAPEIDDFEDLPDGKYQVRIDEAVMTETKETELPMAKFAMTVAGGEQVNRKCWKYAVLDLEKMPRCLSFLKKDLNKLGVEMPDDPAELEDTLPELDGSYAEIQIKTSSKGDTEYKNTYFQIALDEDEVDTDDLEELSEEEDEDDPEEVVEVEDPEEDDPEEDEIEWEKGMECVVDFEGEDFTGEIKSIKGDVANVKFEDGTTEKVDLDELKPVESDEVEEDDPEEDDPEEDGDSEIEITFNDKKLKAEDKKAIKKLAKKLEFDKEDYDTSSEMLADMAVYLKVESGKYSSPKKLLKAIAETE